MVQIEHQIDEADIRPTDFCIKVSNIPRDKKPEDLKEYLHSLFEDVCIEKVIFTYEIYEIVTNLRKKQNLKDHIDK